MRLLYTIFARHVELGRDGSFTIVGGGFHGIRSRHFPVTIPNASLLIKLAADPVESGSFRLGVSLTNPASEPVPAGAAEIPFTVDPGRREATCLLHMQGLEIQQPGLYQFRVCLMGGSEIGNAAFAAESSKEAFVPNNDPLMELSEAEEAISLRKLWMRKMGLDEEEIMAAILTDPPVSIAEEMKQVRALHKLENITPSTHALQQIAIKY